MGTLRGEAVQYPARRNSSGGTTITALVPSHRPRVLGPILHRLANTKLHRLHV